ncbi:related to C-type cyclin [Sporisorium reilianum f. sp. reilianum]|uniref:Related to C-type cyclin n=1 Tax=Sporisorium reilianum f. sp. reilianum TaxID=72559 RepID=A0A2N8UF97_9BASI|nr:related to C-type cyclin [Sporisorium reilianum f. sp. reilianum]
MTASTGTRPSMGQASDDQWLFSKTDLALTPSVLQAGLDASEEKQRRFKAVTAIYRIGEYMRLAQHVMNTAAIYLHRFYMRKALEHGAGANKAGHAHYEIAATCVFLACKVEESHKKLPSVIDAAMASFDRSPAGNQRWAERTFRADPSGKEFARWRDIILVSEETVLETLCFDLIVEHPHEILVKACSRLNVDAPLVRLAWTILNDSLRDAICVMFEAPVLAAGAFYRACQTSQVDPGQFVGTWRNKDGEESHWAWVEIFDVDEAEAAEAAEAIEKDVYDFHEQHGH